jgi:hypothetical protein
MEDDSKQLELERAEDGEEGNDTTYADDDASESRASDSPLS